MVPTSLTCYVDQVSSRLELFASKCGDTINGDQQRRAVHHPPGYGPAPLVVPRDLPLVQRHGILGGDNTTEAERLSISKA